MTTAAPTHAPPAPAPPRTGSVIWTVVALVFTAVGLLAGGIAGVLAGAPAVGLAAGLGLGLLLAAAFVVPARRHGEDRALELLDGRAADPITEARLVNLVEGLCIAGGVARPRLFVLDQAAPNALSFGRDDRHGCLVVTAGLLGVLNRIELEGVLAHELVHLRSGETAGPTAALAVCGRLGTGLLEPLATRLVAWSAPAQREAAADLAAVSLTRYPPGLLAALERIDGTARELPGVPAALDPLWLVPRGAATPVNAVGTRIEALQEL